MPTRQEARVFRELASGFSNFHLFLALKKARGTMPPGGSTNVKLAQQLVRRDSYDGIGMIAIHSKNRPYQATRDHKGNFGAKNFGPDIPHLFIPDGSRAAWSACFATRT